MNRTENDLVKNPTTILLVDSFYQLLDSKDVSPDFTISAVFHTIAAWRGCRAAATRIWCWQINGLDLGREAFSCVGLAQVFLMASLLHAPANSLYDFAVSVEGAWNVVIAFLVLIPAGFGDLEFND